MMDLVLSSSYHEWKYKIMQGEVWEVDDVGLETLDAIEGYPTFIV